jgi:hypothetical protein
MGKRMHEQGLEAALYYAECGWRIFPLHWTRKRRCSCGRKDCSTPGAHPVSEAWAAEATTDSGVVDTWQDFVQMPNIGVVTGEESGVWALQVPAVAQSQFRALCQQYAGVSPQPFLRTFDWNTCDECYLFRTPKGVRLTTTTNLGGLSLSCHAQDGWVALPPSIRLSSACRTGLVWMDLPVESQLVEAPNWLIELITKGKLPTCQASTVVKDHTHMATPAPHPVSEPSEPPLSAAADRVVVVQGESFIINQEFASLLPPLTADERAQLEANLVAAQRCHDPLVRWQGVLIDGHNRLSLIEQRGFPFKVVDLNLPDRAAALAWIVNHQLGKRNLTDEQLQYLRGKRYLAEKQGHGGDRKSDGSSGQVGQLTTAEQLAKDYKVSPRTIRRDAAFAGAVDTLAANCGPTVKQQLLSGGANLDRESVCVLSALDPAEQPAAVEQAVQKPKAKKPKATKPKATTVVPAAQKATAPTELVLRRADGPVRWAQVVIAGVGSALATELHGELGRALSQLPKSSQSEKGQQPRPAKPAARDKKGTRKVRKGAVKPKAPPVRKGT